MNICITMEHLFYAVLFLYVLAAGGGLFLFHFKRYVSHVVASHNSLTEGVEELAASIPPETETSVAGFRKEVK